MTTNDLLLFIATGAFGANITSLAWIMKTLFEMRREISGSHAEFRTTQVDHERRISKLEHKGIIT